MKYSQIKAQWSELNQLGVNAPKLALRDLVRQAIAAVAQRPGRSLATALGTIVGVASVVAIMGIASTASQQVSSQFDALRSTEVLVQYANAGLSAPTTTVTATKNTGPFDQNAVDRLGKLNGVNHAGVIESFDNVPVSTDPHSVAMATKLPILAADPQALAALRVHVSIGRLYDAFHQGQNQPICLLGSAAADRLGVTRIDNLPALWINGRAVVVIGIVDDVAREESAKLGILMPTSTATQLLTGSPQDQVVIETAPGAAQVIAKQAPYVLQPDRPELLKSLAPPDPKQLRRTVEGDINMLFLLVGGISLFIGAVGIANTTLVSVIERIPEIGLRRSLGASRLQIAQQFMLETAIIGTFGGIVGSSCGTIAVVAVGAARHWAPTLDPRVVLLSPLLGTLTGLIAGLQPAIRATRIEPTEALRSGL